MRGSATLASEIPCNTARRYSVSPPIAGPFLFFAIRMIGIFSLGQPERIQIRCPLRRASALEALTAHTRRGFQLVLTPDSIQWGDRAQHADDFFITIPQQEIKTAAHWQVSPPAWCGSHPR